VILLGLLLLQQATPATHAEEISVTATRTETRLADTPASVVVLSREVLQTTAAPTLDDALRQVPGFTLFRRTGSRVANPTTQGLSLRGIGASGASRALVLDDGIPLNDSFGSWVYWSRVSPLALERVEILRGGASELYGSGAIGGVVQFIRRRDDAVTAEVSAGSQSTNSASAFVARSRGGWRGSVSVDAFDTEGYVLVEPDKRGAVDRRADSTHNSFEIALHRQRIFARTGYFRESRNNGTPLQTNETTIRHIAFGGNSRSLTARAWFGDQDYEQTFSAIAADRNSERLTAEQHIPSRNAGATVQWTRAVARRHALLAGVEGRQVSSVGSGRQRTLGLFVEDIVMLTPALSVTTGIRFDDWPNDSAWSPRLALLYRASDRISLTASAYRAFRAPTLNELYRDFRVGNILTLANDSLTAERLTAFEAGARARNIRLTLFWMEMDDVISNVTISTSPALVTRQRRNVAQSRTRGAEIEAEWLLATRLRASAGYLFSDSAVSSGKRLPQVPRHQATAQLTYTSHMTAGLQARWSGMQFDDDLNELRLGSYVVLDLFAAHPIASGVSITLAAENIFDRRIEASATPVITLGQPRAIRAGVRYAR
jgi:outer membrane receptor protein involved in Fe transport